jgi:putative FmdB family regulatory protein
MPTYDYLCKACGHALEIFQSMTEGAKRKCPECGKLQLQRQIGTGGGVIFKGGGFWQTDYRSESYKAGEKAEKNAAKEPAADSKKPATKKADPTTDKTSASKKKPK